MSDRSYIGGVALLMFRYGVGCRLDGRLKVEVKERRVGWYREGTEESVGGGLSVFANYDEEAAEG